MRRVCLSLAVASVLLTFIGADSEDNELINWVLQISKEAAHKIEPKNPVPKAMPRKLAELMVKETKNKHELALLTVYAFAEGGYSLDPNLPGDCHGMPAGTPKCTTRMIEEGIICCDVEHARHFCTLQVEPKPANLEECVHRADTIMKKDISECPDYPGSEYATGGVCGYSYRIAWRAKIVKHLETMENN